MNRAPIFQGSVKAFQSAICTALSPLFPEVGQILSEWRAFQGVGGLYSPRLDVAVGPFSIVRGSSCATTYDRCMDSAQGFIEHLIQAHLQNLRTYPVDAAYAIEELTPTFNNLKNFNRNARCLLAIEVENQVSRKHLLGGAVNASALGRIGVLVGWDAKKVEAMVRLRSYWHFLGSVEKNTFKTQNLLILSPDQLLEAAQVSAPD